MVQVRIEDIPDVPMFTSDEMKKIDRCYHELRRKHDAIYKAGFKRPKPKPIDWEYLQDKKVRDAEVAAGIPRSRR